MSQNNSTIKQQAKKDDYDTYNEMLVDNTFSIGEYPHKLVDGDEIDQVVASHFRKMCMELRRTFGIKLHGDDRGSAMSEAVDKWIIESIQDEDLN